MSPVAAASVGGSALTVRVSSAAPDAEPVWVDISDWVIVPQGSTLDTWLGRMTELPDIEPGKQGLLLLNNDDRFTVGNLTSPYYPWWKQSRRFQIVETLADKEYVHGDGFLEIPQQQVQTQPIDTSKPVLITVAVSGIDLMGRLRSGRKFQSALSEYIVFQGGTELKGYWPMTQSALPYTGFGPTTSAMDMRLTRSGTTGLAVAVQPNTGLAPTGGEASGARCVTAGAGTAGRAFIQAYTPSDFAPAVGASDAICVVFWWAFPASMASNDSSFRQIVNFSGPTTTLALEMSSSSRTWVVTATGQTGTITGGTVGNEALLPIGVYLKESTNTAELWTGSVRLTGALTGAAVGAGTFAWGGMGYQCDYDVSHLQVYVGTNFDYTDFLAQIQQGYAPLDQQRTGARINTILDYAGFSQARRDIDPGASVMSQAVFAGMSAGDLLVQANSTERGRLFAQGGRIQFHDRIRVLNV